MEEKKKKKMTLNEFRGRSSTALQDSAAPKNSPKFAVKYLFHSFFKKNNPAQLLSYEFCEILLHSFFNKARCYYNFLNVF